LTKGQPNQFFLFLLQNSGILVALVAESILALIVLGKKTTRGSSKIFKHTGLTILEKLMGRLFSVDANFLTIRAGLVITRRVGYTQGWQGCYSEVYLQSYNLGYNLRPNSRNTGTHWLELPQTNLETPKKSKKSSILVRPEASLSTADEAVRNHH
jgi:hypothetical protein